MTSSNFLIPRECAIKYLVKLWTAVRCIRFFNHSVYVD